MKWKKKMKKEKKRKIGEDEYINLVRPMHRLKLSDIEIKIALNQVD